MQGERIDLAQAVAILKIDRTAFSRHHREVEFGKHRLAAGLDIVQIHHQRADPLARFGDMHLAAGIARREIVEMGLVLAAYRVMQDLDALAVFSRPCITSAMRRSAG